MRPSASGTSCARATAPEKLSVVSALPLRAQLVSDPTPDPGPQGHQPDRAHAPRGLVEKSNENHPQLAGGRVSPPTC